MLMYLRFYLERYRYNLNKKLSDLFCDHIGNYCIDCYE